MPIIFTCENCGKRIQVDERVQGKRGRCSRCGQVMRIPGAKVAERAHSPAATAAPEAELPFRLSPPEHPNLIPREFNTPDSDAAAHQPERTHQVGPHGSVFPLASPIPAAGNTQAKEEYVRFDLLDDDADPTDVVPVSPAIRRGLQEIAEFEKDPRGYKVVGDRSGVFALFGLGGSRPAGWLYTKWRAGVSAVLKLLRWVDSWAYLISVPFIILMIFGIVVESRRFVHTGAVVVVLANYGRFWADLLAFFVRPYKDGPLQGLAFLLPPYTIYYLTKHWDKMKSIVRRIATSCIPIVLVVLAYAFIPAVNPNIKDVEGVEAKIETGKKELDKEIDQDLQELIKLGEPRKAPSEPH
jgi:hypothetical protein